MGFPCPAHGSASCSSFILFFLNAIFTFLHKRNTWLKFIADSTRFRWENTKAGEKGSRTSTATAQQQQQKWTNWYVRINKNVTFTVNPSNVTVFIDDLATCETERNNSHLERKKDKVPKNSFIPFRKIAVFRLLYASFFLFLLIFFMIFSANLQWNYFLLAYVFI